MDSIYRQVPISDSCSLLDEQQLQGLQGIQSLLQHSSCSKKQQRQSKKFPQTRLSRTLRRLNKLQLQESDTSSESEDEEVSSVNYGSRMSQKPWYTVLTLGGNITPDQVKVKVDRQGRVLIVKTYPRSSVHRGVSGNQPTRHIISLPKNIRLDKLQVKLTQGGHLVVMAPSKFVPQQGMSQPFDLENQILMTPFFQQGCGSRTGNPQQWMTVPLQESTGSRYLPTSSRNTFRGSKRYQSLYGGETETSSSSSEEDTTSTSESESENEYGSSQGYFKGSTTTPSKKIQVVKNYIRLLQKVFYPNKVVAKISPVDTTSSTYGQSKPQLQVVLDIEFVDFHPESELQVRCQGNLLIVEGQKLRRQTSSLTGTTSAVKYARREIVVPQWLDVKQMTCRVKDNRVLRIKLPIRGTSSGSTYGSSNFGIPSNTTGMSRKNLFQSGSKFGGLMSQSPILITKSGQTSLKSNKKCSSRYQY
jgi:HSP20 family molecular chaperone IbpA